MSFLDFGSHTEAERRLSPLADPAQSCKGDEPLEPLDVAVGSGSNDYGFQEGDFDTWVVVRSTGLAVFFYGHRLTDNDIALLSATGDQYLASSDR